MKNLHSNLCNMKVGNWVCTAQYGWCQVLWVSASDDYPITVSVESGKANYTIYGRFYPTDKYPTCFPADQVPKPYLDLFGPPPVKQEFKDGEPVWVSESGKLWYPAVFKKYESGYYWTHGRLGDDLIPWKFCRKWEDKP